MADPCIEPIWYLDLAPITFTFGSAAQQHLFQLRDNVSDRFDQDSVCGSLILLSYVDLASETSPDLAETQLVSVEQLDATEF